MERKEKEGDSGNRRMGRGKADLPGKHDYINTGGDGGTSVRQTLGGE